MYDYMLGCTVNLLIRMLEITNKFEHIYFPCLGEIVFEYHVDFLFLVVFR